MRAHHSAAVFVHCVLPSVKLKHKVDAVYSSLISHSRSYIAQHQTIFHSKRRVITCVSQSVSLSVCLSVGRSGMICVTSKQLQRKLINRKALITPQSHGYSFDKLSIN